AGFRRLQLVTVVADRAFDSRLQPAQPEMLEVAQPRFRSVLAEGVYVGIALPLPALEQDSQLEGGFGRAHEPRLVDAQQFVNDPHRRDRGRAGAAGADLLRLHEGDGAHPAKLARARRGRTPAGRTPAGE